MHTPRTSNLDRLSRFLRLLLVQCGLLALGIALFTAVFLFSPGVTQSLSSAIIALGLDPLRAALIAALLSTTGTALVSALLSRQRLGAIAGAGIAFALSYLLPFIHQEQLPVFDPGGHIETLNMSALEHTVMVLLASSLLCAFLGAAIGSALGEVVLDPIWQLVQMLRLAHVHPNVAKQQERLTIVEETRKCGNWHLIWAWAGLFTMLGLFLLSSGIGDLLLFAPDVGLHNVPVVAAHGTLVADNMASPAFHGQRRSFLVYLPPSYNNPAARKQRYPTLYLLHGSPGSEYDWVKGGKAVQSADTLVAHGETSELIMVFPDGNGRSGETSEWGNSFDQKQLMENFVAFDLVHYIDQTYRTIPQANDRAIGGNSMGGFGALNIAVHHPDIFGSVISLGGYFKAEGRIWGQNATYMRANSPAFVLPKDLKAWNLRIFLGAASKDQPYYTDTKQLSQELKALRMTYTFDLEIGYHAWNIWETQLYHALTWLSWR